MRAQGAKSDLLGIVGSYKGDTMDDEDVLRVLRYFREHGTVYASVLARV